MRKDDGENTPKGGYHFLLETENDLLETLFTVTAGQSKILEPVYSPSLYQQFDWVPSPSPDQLPYVSAGFLWEASIRAMIPAFDPNFAVGREFGVIMK